MSTNATSAININRLTLSFGGQPVLTDLNFSVFFGEWIALLGRSGCGKSTLLKAIAGLDHGATQSGTIHLNADIAYMAQQDSLLPWLSVVDNVQLSNYLAGTKNKKTRQNSLELLAQVGLCEHANKFPYELSGGQRQRVALARTLMQTAHIILMDEPFSAVDAITRLELQTLSSELLADKTVILITHDPQEAVRLSDRMYVMKNAGLSDAITPDYLRPRLHPQHAQPELQQTLLTMLS